jgi:hypothetical protein
MTTSPLTEQQLDDIDARHKAATKGPWTVSENYSDVLGPDGDQLASYWDPTSQTRNGEFIAHAREDVPALLDEVRRLRFRLAELGEQGPNDRETVSEAAQMYRSLRAVIERTMTDPDRWDGDEDESFHLGRYVEWLAAGQPDDDEPDTFPAAVPSV